MRENTKRVLTQYWPYRYAQSLGGMEVALRQLGITAEEAAKAIGEFTKAYKGKLEKNMKKGTSLIETLVAVAICTTVVFGFAAAIGFSTKVNKSQGQALTQATTLASQKLDQLLEAPWTSPNLSATSSTCPSGWFLQWTPGGWGCALMDPSLIPGGDLDNDQTGYSEYLDSTGTVIASATSSTAGVMFSRRWIVQDQACGSPGCLTSLKQITVTVAGTGFVKGATATVGSLKAQN